MSSLGNASSLRTVEKRRRSFLSPSSSSTTAFLAFVTLIAIYIPSSCSSFGLSTSPSIHKNNGFSSFIATTPLHNNNVQQLQQRHATSSGSSSRFSSIILKSTLHLEHPPSEEQNKTSFEDRMRNLVLGRRRKANNNNSNEQQQRQRRQKASSISKRPENLKMATTLKEYKAVVGDEKKRIVAVRFYAPWCKACKANAPLFYRLASTFPNVVFVEVPVTEKNVNLHQGLGVPSLPFGHIYLPPLSPDDDTEDSSSSSSTYTVYAGLVEEQSVSRKNFPSFAKKLKAYVTGSCEIEDNNANEDDDFYGSNPYKIYEPTAAEKKTKAVASEAPLN